jgi:hypothetical protein
MKIVETCAEKKPGRLTFKDLKAGDIYTYRGQKTVFVKSHNGGTFCLTTNDYYLVSTVTADSEVEVLPDARLVLR